MTFEAPGNKIVGQLSVGTPTIFNGDTTNTPVQVGANIIRTDGSTTATRMYINTNGITGWTNVTTAA